MQQLPDEETHEYRHVEEKDIKETVDEDALQESGEWLPSQDGPATSGGSGGSGGAGGAGGAGAGAAGAGQAVETDPLEAGTHHFHHLFTTIVKRNKSLLNIYIYI